MGPDRDGGSRSAGEHASPGERSSSSGPGSGAERGASSLELVMYMPLLLTAILIAVQFSLVYLGNQAVSAAAREAARAARVTGSVAEGRAEGRETARALGRGVLSGPATVAVAQIGDQMRAVVSADGQQLVPFLDPPRLVEEIQGPVEQFVDDG